MGLSSVERARRYIAKCPRAISGQGGHDATYHVAACLVHGFALGEPDALALLSEYNRRCVPPWSERELRHKIESVSRADFREPRGCLLGPGAVLGPQRRLTPRCTPAARPASPVEAAESFLKGFRCDEADLYNASPVALDGEPRFDGALLVENLYAPGELVNLVTEYETAMEKSGEIKARPVGWGITLERDALAARFRKSGSDSSKGGAWLRMNPVDGRGVADANVRACRFALLESDKLSLELQFSLFAKLPLPIAAVLSSGGRSVHAWVKADARDAEDYRETVARMLEILVRFGVDGKNKNPSRLSRLPGARREIGAAGDGVQRLMYLNPKPDGRSIL
ncbi:MAG: hypothetical protein AAB676_21550 [Verrucomicrobiota bacterium]